MNDSEEASGRAQPKTALARSDYDLRGCFGRHRALASTWNVFPALGIASEDHYISNAIASLRSELEGYAEISPIRHDESALPKVISCIDSLESELRSMISEVSLDQMRTALPAQVQKDRASVVALLDLLLDSVITRTEHGAACTSTIDFVITMLCTNGGRSESIVDPLTLSPKLYGLCEIARESEDPRIPEIVAKFLAAADDIASSNLSQCKAELAELYFVPDVLRVVVAYNAALWYDPAADVPVASESEDDVEEIYESQLSTTVFVSSILPKLGEALRRRSAGEEPKKNAVDRIAWRLDLNLPTEDERRALLSPLIGRSDELLGTAILIGLLCREVEGFEDDFEKIGATSALLRGEWTREISEALKREVDQLIVSNHYESACAISDLRGKFLLSLVTEEEREIYAPSRPNSEEVEAKRLREELSDLARKAAVGDTAKASVRPVERDNMRRHLMMSVGSVVAALVVFAVTAFVMLNPDDGLQRMESGELALVSPYLDTGERSLEGSGRTFVGTVHRDWGLLEQDIQQVLAEEIVDALRAKGVREIMIYDGDDALRIQALGTSAVKLLTKPIEAAAS